MTFADIEAQLQEHKLESLELRYETVYRDVLVICTLERTYFKALPVSATAGNDDDAINSALKLLARIEELEKEIGDYVKAPEPDAQPHEGGYCNLRVTDGKDVFVRYKRRGAGFVIKGVLRIDEAGFVWTDEPFFIPNDFKFVRYLEHGASLYEWDRIGVLTGTAGQAIVLDGKVIKTKMTAIA